VRAAILAIGTELLGTDRLDTNSLQLTAALASHGFELQRKAVVGDDEGAIVRELERCCADAELVLLTGGLGPTRDDLTRDAVARFAGRPLELDPRELTRLEERYRSFGRTMPPSNRRQCEVIAGAEVLANPVGTAPGQLVRVGGCHVFLFPGVPRELTAMIESALVPWLRAHAGPERTAQVELVTACVPESAIEDRLGPAYDALGREPITVLAKAGEVRVRVSARGVGDALAKELERRRDLIAPLLGDALTSQSGEALEQVVVSLLRDHRATVAVAESCTGGLLGERITRVAGSSEVFVGGAIVYSNRLKRDLVGVSEDLLREHGAVSAPVARAMAEGARRRFDAALALSITGIAGPGGGTPDKPVGTVHLALAGAHGTDAWHVRLPGGREGVRWQSTQLALDLLRRHLCGLPLLTFWSMRGESDTSDKSDPGKTGEHAPTHPTAALATPERVA
jgi:nicotinamide-nucleotide amidase